MFTLAQSLFTEVRRRARLVRSTGETGLQTVEWIFLVVGILAIAAIVITAVTVFVQGQVGKLPG
jgi:hypothetical protein